jgi:hypothetical protein
MYTLWHRVMVQILPSEPWDFHKKPTKSRQKAVLEMAVFQYASSAVHQYANPSPAGQSRKAHRMITWTVYSITKEKERFHS